MVQLHGDESRGFADSLGLPWIKAFRVKGPCVTDRIMEFGAAAFVLDSFVRGVPGGTGKMPDPDLTGKAAALGRAVLAGGLDPENVYGMLERFRPCAVDVSSGVEISPGRKDHGKVKNFVSEVKRSNSKMQGDTSEASVDALFRRRSRELSRSSRASI
jgi:phosphoribosylanthranilate isomerase